MSFWIICFAYYTRRLIDAVWLEQYPCVVGLTGASLGLALLTKGTTYIFALPFLLQLMWSARRVTRRRLAMLATIAVVALSMNASHFARNIKTFGYHLGPRPDFQYGYNAILNPAVVISNGIRNLGLHMSTPSLKLDALLLDAVNRAHRLIGLDVNDARTTFGAGNPWNNFDISKPSFHEDFAGNGLHLLLLAFSIVAALTATREADAMARRAYALSLLTGFGVFCAVIKWQIWGSRLQPPLFVLGAPIIAAILARRLSREQAWGVVMFVLIAALPWVAFNQSRPLVAKRIGDAFGGVEGLTVFNTPRRDLYFRNRPELAVPYQAAASRVKGAGCRHVGLVLGDDGWEYPFWVLLDEVRPSTRLSHVLQVTEERAKVHCAVLFVDGADSTDLLALARVFDTRWTSGPVTLFTEPRSIP